LIIRVQTPEKDYKYEQGGFFCYGKDPTQATLSILEVFSSRQKALAQFHLMMNFHLRNKLCLAKNMTKLLDSRVPLLLTEKFQKMYQIDLNHKNWYQKEETKELVTVSN
jgi:hypothetical protein